MLMYKLSHEAFVPCQTVDKSIMMQPSKISLSQEAGSREVNDLIDARRGDEWPHLLALAVAIMVLKDLRFKNYFSLELFYLSYDYCRRCLQKLNGWRKRSYYTHPGMRSAKHSHFFVLGF